MEPDGFIPLTPTQPTASPDGFIPLTPTPRRNAGNVTIPQDPDSFLTGMWKYTGGAVPGMLHLAGEANKLLHPGSAALTGQLPDPTEALSGNIEMGRRAAEQYQAGNPMGAVAYGAAAATPWGPMVADIGETYREGKPWEATGKIAGAGVTAAVPWLAGKGKAKFGEMFEADPHDLITRAIKPTSTNVKWDQSAEMFMPRMKQAEAAMGKPIRTIEDYLQAVDVAKKQNRNAWKIYMGKNAGVYVDGTPIADAMVDSITPKLRLENPRRAAQIEQMSDRYRRTFSVDEMEDLLHNVNGELSAYYAKYPPQQWKALMADPAAAYREAQAVAMRDTLYKALDDPNLGTGPRQLQREYGALLDAELGGYRRLNVANRQQPESLAQQLGYARAAGHFLRGLAGGHMGAGDMVMAGGEALAAHQLKEMQTTNSLIARAFKNYKGTPAPLPMPEVFSPYRPGLPEPSHKMPPAPDASYVQGRPAYPFGVPGGPKALPPGTAPFTQGTVVPDILGRPGRTSDYMIGGPDQPSIPTTGEIRPTSGPETSSVQGSRAAYYDIVDPKTGKPRRIFLSSPTPPPGQ